MSKLNWIQFIGGFLSLSLPIICYVLAHLLHIHFHAWQYVAIVLGFCRTIYWKKYHPWSSECGLLLPVSRLTISLDCTAHSIYIRPVCKTLYGQFKCNLCIEMGDHIIISNVCCHQWHINNQQNKKKRFRLKRHWCERCKKELYIYVCLKCACVSFAKRTESCIGFQVAGNGKHHGQFEWQVQYLLHTIDIYRDDYSCSAMAAAGNTNTVCFKWLFHKSISIANECRGELHRATALILHRFQYDHF